MIRNALRSVVRRRRPAPRAPRHRYVVVVTYGRSGSTLVQGLLNTLPRTVVRGENTLYVVDLFRAMHRVRVFRDRHRRHATRAPHSAFYGLHELRPKSFVSSARALLTGHLLGDLDPHEVEVLGFKEVLWHRVEPEETEAFFAYFDRLLPGCRYVLNQRRLEKVVDSGFWRRTNDPGDIERQIHRVEEIQDFLRTSRPDRVLDVTYEGITSDDRDVSDAQLRSLAEFAHGSCDDELLDRMRETLATGHGPYPFGASKDA